MSDLKPLPCPFCGGAPRSVERPDNIDGTRFFYALACYCGGYSACAHKMAVEPTPEQAKRTAIEAWNRRAQPAQAGQVLSDAEIDALYAKSDLDADPGSDYGCGFYSGARWAEQAVRAKLGVAVPMTPEETDKAMQSMFYPARNRAFMDGVRAAEQFHGIVSKEGA